MHRLILYAAAGIALAGCDQQEAGPVDAEVAPTSAADAAQTLEGERSLADETETGPTRARDVASGDIVPARFHGVWDAAKGTCDPASDLRVEIGPDRIEFYESAGEVTGVIEENGRIMADLALQGEGETWTNRLALSLDGDRLTLDDPDAPGVGGAPARVRCPG
ncbi:hypothetical protein J3454_06485 [Erythrobacter sp. NFXS35]|uniref:hypothetical protein n=1 Tax=Erythrobacter sp. NFXS35 TaxID=2818436 RepID=UPI0032DE4F45